MCMNKKRFISLGLIYLLFSVIIFGFATIPVLGAVGLTQDWTNATYYSNYPMALDISKNGDYNYFVYSTSSHRVWDEDGTSVNQIGVSGGITSGGMSNGVFKRNTNQLWITKTTTSLQRYDYINDIMVGTEITGLSPTGNDYSRLMFSYDDSLLIWSSLEDATDDGSTIIVNMDTESEDLTIDELYLSEVSETDLSIFGFSEKDYTGFYGFKGSHILKYSMESGLLMASENITTMMNNLGVSIDAQDVRTSHYQSKIAVTEDAVYFGVRNNSDNSEFYIIRSNLNLNSFSILLDNTSLDHRTFRLDATKDDTYLLVGYFDSSDNMEMYYIDNQTLIDSGCDGATGFFSLDGAFVFADDNIDNDLFYYSTEYEIDLDVGQGEGDTDLSDYEQRCSFGFLGYAKSTDYQVIEDYIYSFGDVEINAVELMISDDQVGFVSSNRTSYNAYLNGVSIGKPNYLFQYDETRYVLQWSDLNIDVGTNDIILEFRNTYRRVGFVSYWLNIPMGTTDFARYGGTFGNGYFDGTLWDGLGLGTCLYYTLNAIPESNNTYDIDIISIDPHERGNSTEFRINVTGNESWTWLIVDPNGRIVEQDYMDNGNNIFYRSRIIEEDWITGEYTIYALDYDSYPSGLSIAENETFNVTVYGGGNEWFIGVTYDPIVIGTYQGFSYYVPTGYNYAILWMYHPTSEADTILQGVGDGALHTVKFGVLCDKLGLWSITLQNRTSSDTTEWDWYRVQFDCVKQIVNYIELGEQGNYICDNGYATILGFYDGEIGTLWVKKNENVFKSFPLTGGGFEHRFYPDDYQEAWGIYDVFITNAEGETLDWSSGLKIEVYDCEDEGEPSTGITDTSWYGLPWFMPYIIGIFITLIITMSPLLLAVFITKKTRINKINIPNMLYVGFFFLGLIFNVLIGFLPIWLPFVILFAMIIFFTVQWLYGKKESSVQGD